MGYWQKILGRPGCTFLAGPMAGAGMARSFSGFTWLTRLAEFGLLVLVAPFQEPRTEYHPSLSGCSGRPPSPVGNSL